MVRRHRHKWGTIRERKPAVPPAVSGGLNRRAPVQLLDKEMKRTLLLLCMVATWGAGVATATECKGVRFADQVQVDGTTLTLNGVGLHQATMFNVDAYVAGLYLTNTSSDPKGILESNSPYLLTLQLLRNVGAGDIRKG